MKIKLNYILLLLVIATNSCKKNDDDSNIPSNCTNITGWLKNGHQFVYVNEPILFFADTLTTTIEEVSAGVFKGTNVFDDGSTYPSFSGYTKPCGNDIYSAADVAMSNASVTYHVDGNINDTWSSVATSLGGYKVTNTYKITGKNISVTVPAGTFSCLKINVVSVSTQPGALTVITDIYLNNESGMIKTDGNTTHYELARKNF